MLICVPLVHSMTHPNIANQSFCSNFWNVLASFWCKARNLRVTVHFSLVCWVGNSWNQTGMELSACTKSQMLKPNTRFMSFVPSTHKFLSGVLCQLENNNDTSGRNVDRSDCQWAGRKHANAVVKPATYRFVSREFRSVFSQQHKSAKWNSASFHFRWGGSENFVCSCFRAQRVRKTCFWGLFYHYLVCGTLITFDIAITKIYYLS